MIGIYADDVETRLAMGYRALTINDDAYPVSSIAVDHRYDSVIEANAQADGMEAYGARRMVTMLTIDGIVKGDSVAQLHDRIEALNEAFDPVLATDGDVGDINIGFLPFTFSVPTADTASYPTGLIPMQYYARSVQLPVSRVSKYEGEGARFTIVLQAVDPRRYLQTASTHTFTGTAYESVANGLASYSSWPTFTITMSAAGGGNVDLRSEEFTDACRLDLTGVVAGDVVVVDFERREITVNGVTDMSLFNAGAYWRMLPQAQNVRVDDMTGIASAVMSWRRAFV